MSNANDYVELARVWRGGVLESTHRGAVAVANLGGGFRHAWGNVGNVTFPRSALKPFQAVALVESGAADAFGLTDEHIALACASHQAQPFHVALAQDWLAKLGLDESALLCGPALPQNPADIATAYGAGGARRIYNDCSGKHLGFLTVAKHLGTNSSYADRDHPAQRIYLDVLSEYTGKDASAMPYGVDSCGLPAIALTVGDMAKAAARFGAGQGKTAARRAAVRRVLNAMTQYPDHLAGTDAPVARMIRGTNGEVLVKSGAEGYLLAFSRLSGHGVAIKMADGNARAAYGVLARVLARIGEVAPAEAERLIGEVVAPVKDSNGNVVGRVEIPFQAPEQRTPTRATMGFWVAGVPVLEDVFKP